MNSYLLAAMSCVIFVSCNLRDVEMQKEQISSLRSTDSVLIIKTQSQDSTILAYIRSFNEIEDNLDSIKMKAKFMTISSMDSRDKKNLIIGNMRYIGDLMMKNRTEMQWMRKKLKGVGLESGDLGKMLSHLSEQINDKNAEIASLQLQLAQVNTTLKSEMNKINDSMNVIQQKYEKMNENIAELQSIYYTIGSEKELKKNGIIQKEGGFIGLGANDALTNDIKTAYFTKADMNSLHGIALYSKFKRFVTNHPVNSFKIRGDKKSDSLLITNPSSFWSESKYLVVVVKPY
jgi:hypothetical protein